VVFQAEVVMAVVLADVQEVPVAVLLVVFSVAVMEMVQTAVVIAVVLADVPEVVVVLADVPEVLAVVLVDVVVVAAVTEFLPEESDVLVERLLHSELPMESMMHVLVVVLVMVMTMSMMITMTILDHVMAALPAIRRGNRRKVEKAERVVACQDQVCN